MQTAIRRRLANAIPKVSGRGPTRPPPATAEAMRMAVDALRQRLEVAAESKKLVAVQDIWEEIHGPRYPAFLPVEGPTTATEDASTLPPVPGLKPQGLLKKKKFGYVEPRGPDPIPKPEHPIRSIKYLKKVILNLLEANGRIKKTFVTLDPDTPTEKKRTAKQMKQPLRAWGWTLIEPPEGKLPYEEAIPQMSYFNEIERRWTEGMSGQGARQAVGGEKDIIKMRENGKLDKQRFLLPALRDPKLSNDHGINYGLPKNAKLLKMAKEREEWDQKPWTYQPKEDVSHLNKRRAASRAGTQTGVNHYLNRAASAQEKADKKFFGGVKP